MVLLHVRLPDPDEWPLRIFLFARWKKYPPPPPETLAYSHELNYYLRIMRGPHWRLTVPLCVHGATDWDVSWLETALAYMETSFCARWFYPMSVWTPTRVFLIAVHAWASQDPRIQGLDVQGFRDLIPHVTPHARSLEPADMSATVAGLAQMAKESFPLEIFNYRQIYYREHQMAISQVFGLELWKDAGTQCDASDVLDETASEAGSGSGSGPGSNNEGHHRGTDGELPQGFQSEIHCAEDPREGVTILVNANTLPRLFSDGVLLRIPLASGSEHDAME